MKIGLLGAGTIGFGVVELADQTDDLKIIKILDRRDIPELRDRLTTVPDSILEDSEIDTVIELLGGVEPAFTWVSKALLAGKNVVTANKFLVSEKLPELLEAARKGSAQLRFSAAVGGGIPILVNLLRARRLDTVQEVGGVLNGTTNYILTKMAEDGLDFDVALKQAQELGYAEADPTADVSGRDTLCKIALASSIAWNALADKHVIPCEGITRVKAQDMKKATELGYTCKLLARAINTGDTVCATVEPTLVRNGSVPSGIRLVENMAFWKGANAGVQRFTGAGAGRYATAYAVLNDVTDMNGLSLPFSVNDRKLALDASSVSRRYLVRGLVLPGNQLDQWILTDEVTPETVHTLAAQAAKDGRDFFFAGIMEE